MSSREVLVEWLKAYAFSLSGVVRKRAPGDQDYLPETVAESLSQYGLVRVVDDGSAEMVSVRWICDDIFPDHAGRFLVEKTIGIVDEYPEPLAQALRDAGKVELLTGSQDHGRNRNG